ncbi:MAG TPA: hypothetical protein VK670_01790, partial [Silvibacterium sp.]|nr:hypothetical protein [Silvibacterium sp.]
GELGGLGSRFGIWMASRQGKVTIDEEQLVAEMFLHALDDRVRAATMRALVVSILDQSAARSCIALGVVFWAYWSSELGHINP